MATLSRIAHQALVTDRECEPRVHAADSPTLSGAPFFRVSSISVLTSKSGSSSGNSVKPAVVEGVGGPFLPHGH